MLTEAPKNGARSPDPRKADATVGWGAPRDEREVRDARQHSGRRCPFPRPPFVLEATTLHEREEAMKYILLIHQGDSPTPYSDDWESLSEGERNAVYAD
jgi:hypothetical protein